MSAITAMIPAFNEESRISAVVEEVKRYIQKVNVVDDGSTDLTGEVASSARAIVVGLDQNQGYINAIKRDFMMPTLVYALSLSTVENSCFEWEELKE